MQFLEKQQKWNGFANTIKFAYNTHTFPPTFMNLYALYKKTLYVCMYVTLREKSWKNVSLGVQYEPVLRVSSHVIIV